MKKLCLSCMRKIPLLAGRCPYCLAENQGVYGRILLLVLFITAIIIMAYTYTANETPNKKEQLIEIINNL